jgi:hypothetical protein
MITSAYHPCRVGAAHQHRPSEPASRGTGGRCSPYEIACVRWVRPTGWPALTSVDLTDPEGAAFGNAMRLRGYGSRRGSALPQTFGPGGEVEDGRLEEAAGVAAGRSVGVGEAFRLGPCVDLVDLLGHHLE